MGRISFGVLPLFLLLTKDMKKIAVIINPRSGSNAKLEEFIKKIRDIFLSFQVEPKIVLLYPVIDLKQKIAGLLTEGHEIIVAAGGDGTISSVARELVGTKAILGVIPNGTFNHFAKDVGIPLDIFEAIAVIVNGTPRYIDVGSVNDTVFINNSSIGIYSQLVRRRTELEQRGWGRYIGFIKIVAYLFIRRPFIKARLLSRGEERFARTPFVFIGNNHYTFSGIGLGSRHALNQNVLTVCTMPGVKRWQLLALIARGFIGWLRPHTDIEATLVKEVRVVLEKPFVLVSIDGEIATIKTPLYYKSKPKALALMLP